MRRPLLLALVVVTGTPALDAFASVPPDVPVPSLQPASGGQPAPPRPLFAQPARPYPAPPPPGYGYPPPVPRRIARPRHERDSWYIGFGLGSGVGRWTNNGQEENLKSAFGDLDVKAPVSINLGAGWTLTRATLIGAELSGLTYTAKTTDLRGSPMELSLGVTNLLAVVTYFPTSEGLFVKGGLGVGWLRGTENVGGELTEFENEGFAWSIGAGYAFWLGRAFNLTVNVDWSTQTYDEPDKAQRANITASRFWHAWLGCYWY